MASFNQEPHEHNGRLWHTDQSEESGVRPFVGVQAAFVSGDSGGPWGDRENQNGLARTQGPRAAYPEARECCRYTIERSCAVPIRPERRLNVVIADGIVTASIAIITMVSGTPRHSDYR